MFRYVDYSRLVVLPIDFARAIPVHFTSLDTVLDLITRAWRLTRAVDTMATVLSHVMIEDLILSALVSVNDTHVPRHRAHTNIIFRLFRCLIT